MMGMKVLLPDPVVWSAGALPKRRRLVHAVNNLVMLLGPPAIWLGEWVAGPSVALDGPAVIDARRNFSGVCGRWYLVLLDLHRFFIVICGAVVNRDVFGGTAPDPMVWSAGSLPKRRRIVHAVRNLAMLPGPLALWLGEWVAGLAVTVGVDDVAQWPYTPGLLV